MRRLLAIVCMLACLGANPARAESDTWSSNGPFGGRVLALAASPEYLSDGLFFCGTDGAGLFRSHDQGHSWYEVSGLPTVASVPSVAFSPAFATDQTLFLATLHAGLYRSIDRGLHWELWGATLPTLAVADLAVSPHFTQDRRLIAATDRGLYLSADAGLSWSAVVSGSANCVVASPSTDETFVSYAGASDGLYVSNDSGTTWEATGVLTSSPVIAVALSPHFSEDQTLAIGTLTGALYSTDGGATWTAHWLPHLAVRDIVFSSSSGPTPTLYLGTDAGVYVAVNGQPPTPVETQVQDTVHALLLPSPDEPLLFVGADCQGVLHTTDDGKSWQPRNTGLTALSFEAVAVSPNYEKDRTIFVGGPGGVWRSRDDGVSWSATALDQERVRALLCSPSYALDRTVYAATDGGVFVSRDGGRSWAASSKGLDDLQTRALTIDNLGRLYIATQNASVYYSADQGASWALRASAIATSPVSALEWLQGSSSHLVAGTLGAGNLVSADGGEAWQAAVMPQDGIRVRTLASAIGFGGQPVAFAASDTGVLRSLDLGETWSRAGSAQWDTFAVTTHPNYAARPNVYAGSDGDGVYFSSNGGLNWQSLNEGLGNLHIHGLDAARASTTAMTLFAATRKGVWRYGPPPVAPTYELCLPWIAK